MAALGDRPAAKITTREVEALLATVSATGVSPRTVNKHRAVISAAFNYGCRASTFGLPANPASEADKRREPQPGALVYYSPEEVEALARALADGRHREPSRQAVGEQEREARRAEDQQDAELVRVAAYAGLRLGELLALRWRDVDFAGHALTVGRAMSAGVESSTKSGRVRRVPLPDQAAAALDRLSRREDFTGADERVFCNVLGRTLDGSALRRRYKRAQRRRRPAPAALPRPAPHLRLAARRCRRGSRDDQERDGPQRTRHHRTLPARAAREPSRRRCSRGRLSHGRR